jgi:muconolactone D-isomerase
MEFLVEVQTSLPADMDPDERAGLLKAEAEYAGDLVSKGVINRIWRVPGRTASKGIWVADDGTQLHKVLAGLPLYPWLDVKVTPLATHYLEDPTAGP